MGTQLAKHPFTDFVDALIDKTSAKNALTRLQAQQTLNTNLILYAIWLSQQQQGRLTRQDHKILLATIQAWHERVLVPLQRLLVAATNQPQLKHSTMLTELIMTEINMAEQIERHLMASTLLRIRHSVRNPSQQLSDACHSITNYCRLLQIQIDNEDQVTINHLLQTAFPDLLDTEITLTCQNVLNLSTSPKDPPFSQLSLDEF